MGSSRWITVREAWERALYRPGGFYRSELPRDHFRTSANASSLFADAILTLVRRAGLGAVIEIGAGSGEVLSVLSQLAPELQLTGVDIRPRPDPLRPEVAWRTVDPVGGGDLGIARDTPPALLLANELLDNIACELVELDEAGVVRVLEVDPGSGEQRLGAPAPRDDFAWLDKWWPLTVPGMQAEVGRTRDLAWSAACRQLPAGVCLTIDYGHVRTRRPPVSTLTSYRAGRQYPATFDGRHDVTAHVAVDAVAAAAHADLFDQRTMLRDLGVTGARPDLSLATSAPSVYLRELARAGEASELTRSPGPGDFHWLITRRP